MAHTAAAQVPRQFSLMELGRPPGSQRKNDACRYSFTCGTCSSHNDISALSMDRRGYLNPVRCKACGMAARPVGARCEACQSQWQTCVSRPNVGEGSVVHAALRSVHQWVFPFATDFSGMDMAAFLPWTECCLGTFLLLSDGLPTSGIRLGSSVLVTIPLLLALEM